VIWQTRIDAWNDDGDYFKDVTETADGGVLLAIDSVGHPNFDRAQLRLVKLDASGELLWMHDYGGPEGDAPGCIQPLPDGGFLVAGSTVSFSGGEGWEAWLLRLDEDGLVGGDGCGFTSSVQTTVIPISFQVTDTDAVVQESSVARFATDVEIRDLPVTRIEQCSAPACLPVRCDDIAAFPNPVCEGEAVTLRLGVACGEGPLSVGWDLDGDDIADEQGSEVVVTLPPGEHQVKAIVTDSCADPGPQRCEVTRTVTVLSSEPPGEVSGSGEPRLRVAPRGTAVRVEADPEVTAYNVYADAIGSWYGPTAASGSVCGITEWTDNGDGTITLDYALPVNSWIVVTGSTLCAEGPAGRGSAGEERTTQGVWEFCGPSP